MVSIYFESWFYHDFFSRDPTDISFKGDPKRCQCEAHDRQHNGWIASECARGRVGRGRQRVTVLLSKGHCWGDNMNIKTNLSIEMDKHMSLSLYMWYSMMCLIPIIIYRNHRYKYHYTTISCHFIQPNPLIPRYCLSYPAVGEFLSFSYDISE